MGLSFDHPLGLAAGFDKNAILINHWHKLGFSFVEIGTVTPRPQPGNEKPRLFRLPSDKALINRMGFNNDGVEAVVSRLKTARPSVVIGGNIGKNKDTPNEQAVDDYLLTFKALYPHVDYFVVNVSSPNTPGLRELQDKDKLTVIVNTLLDYRAAQDIKKPVLLKFAPDVTESQVGDIISLVNALDVEGVVATNTTISREGLKTDEGRLKAIGMGGLSGRPLHHRSVSMVSQLRAGLRKDKVIIGVGGIFDAADARRMLEAGADLLQSYTGFIYEGPAFVRRIVKDL